MAKSTRPVNPEDGLELFDDELNVISSTECTGMVPTPPKDEAQVESYSNIYDIPLTKSEQAGLHSAKGTHNARDPQ